jgi:hypothetical protein
MMIFDLLFGALLICGGRNLFWLCVGIVGFLIGVQCTPLLGYANGWMATLMAFALGCLGALLSISFEWFMAVFGIGFLGGGYLLMNIFPPVAGQEAYSWLIFVVGGIIGMSLMIIVFDWTIIIISSLLGATLIINAFPETAEFREILFVICMVMGILIQYGTLKITANHDETSRR